MELRQEQMRQLGERSLETGGECVCMCVCACICVCVCVFKCECGAEGFDRFSISRCCLVVSDILESPVEDFSHLSYTHFPRLPFLHSFCLAILFPSCHPLLASGLHFSVRLEFMYTFISRQLDAVGITRTMIHSLFWLTGKSACERSLRLVLITTANIYW